MWCCQVIWTPHKCRWWSWIYSWLCARIRTITFDQSKQKLKDWTRNGMWNIIYIFQFPVLNCLNLVFADIFMSVKFEDSHIKKSQQQSISTTSTHQIQQDQYWENNRQGQGQHHISFYMDLACYNLEQNAQCTLKLSISYAYEHFWIHNYSVCCFRRGHLGVQCVEKCSSAPPPSLLICSYIQTPGPTPASTVAKGSTRSRTWRNTPLYTPVGLWGFDCFFKIYIKVMYNNIWKPADCQC